MCEFVIRVIHLHSDPHRVALFKNQLVIRGRQVDQPERIYLHRGIAARQFRRAFVLADGLEVVSAALDKGLLAIELHRPVTAGEVRTIAIRTQDDAAASGKVAARQSGGQT